MFEFFENIANFFVSIFDFIMLLVNGLVSFLFLLLDIPSFLVMSIGVLPSICVAFATAIIAILIIKVILGR